MKKRKILSILLAFCMLFTLMPTVFAGEIVDGADPTDGVDLRITSSDIYWDGSASSQTLKYTFELTAPEGWYPGGAVLVTDLSEFKDIFVMAVVGGSFTSFDSVGVNKPFEMLLIPSDEETDQQTMHGTLTIILNLPADTSKLKDDYTVKIGLDNSKRNYGIIKLDNEIPQYRTFIEKNYMKYPVTSPKFIVRTTEAPIRAVEDTANITDPDPNDPTGSKIQNPDGYLVPGKNLRDENGKGDDLVVKPNTPTDPKKPAVIDPEGSLLLPSGATVTDASGKSETVPPYSKIDPNGTIYYGVKVYLKDKTTGDDLTAPATFEDIIYVEKGATSIGAPSAPTIANYRYDSMNPAKTADLLPLSTTNENKLDLLYVYTGNDPIRAVEDTANITAPDPTDPTGSKITNPEGYVVPGPNHQDQSGEGDDSVVTPNPATDPQNPATVDPSGSLLLPDGGTLTGPSGTETLPPNTKVNPDGTIQYGVKLYLKDKNTQAELTAPAGFEDIIYVAKTATSMATPAAPNVTGYSYDSMSPSNTSALFPLSKTRENKIDLFYTYGGKDPIRAVEDTTDITDPDPTDPTGSKIPNPDGYVIPGQNNQDQNGKGDDSIVKPNPATDPKNPTTVDPSGSLILPDGGTMTGPGGSESLPPNTKVDPDGTVQYGIKLYLKDKNTLAALTAPAGFVDLIYVAKTATSVAAPAAPSITGYKFVEMNPANTSALFPLSKTQENKIDLLYTYGDKDPIRAVEDTTNITNPDPADPTGSKIPNPDGYVIPGQNNMDQNGKGDDSIVKPNPATDPQNPAVIDPAGNLILPDGGTMTGPGGSESLPPNSLVEPDGTVKYGIKVYLKDKNTQKQLTAPTGFATIIYVAKDATSVTAPVAPNVPNYTYDSMVPSKTADLFPLSKTKENKIDLLYTQTTEDPIRAVDDPANITDPDPNDPAGDKITNPGGYVVPGQNKQDENGDGDDSVVVPNTPTDPNKPATKDPDGSLILPDGGTLTGPNGTESLPPNSKVDPDGTIQYGIKLYLKDKYSLAELTAPEGFVNLIYVAKTATSVAAPVAPSVAGYLYDSMDPAQTSALFPLKTNAENKIDLLYVSTSEDPIRAVEDTANIQNPDPNDPTGENIKNPGGYVVPGENTQDENGGGDDVVVTPNPATDPNNPAKVDPETDRLVLPDGGTSNKGDVYKPGTEIEANGVLWLPIEVKLWDVTVNPSGTVSLDDMAPNGYMFIKAFREDMPGTVFAPSIEGFILQGPSYVTKNVGEIPATVDFNYVKDNGGSIRPYDPEDPTNVNPADSKDFLAPGTDGIDNSGNSGSDDVIISPNDPTGTNEPAKVDSDGNLVLPDGGKVNYPDSDSRDDVDAPAGSIVTPNGDVFVIVTAKLTDVTDPAHKKSIEAPKGFEKEFKVNYRDAADVTIAAPYLGREYILQSDPTLHVNAQKEAPAEVEFEYIVKDPVDVVTITINMLQNGTTTVLSPAITQTVNKSTTSTAIYAPAVSGYSPTQTSQSVIPDADKAITFYYTKNSSGGGGGGGGGATYYALSFETNGGNAIASVTKVAGTTISLSDYPATHSDKRVNFLGWYSDKELQNPVTTIKLTENKVVYAKWDNIVLTTEHVDYIIGDDGLIRPDDKITRAEVATIIFRLLDDPSRSQFATTKNSFGDISATDWYNKAVSTIANANFIVGYPDGTFQANNNITRAEMAAMFARYLRENYSGTDLYSDISGHWAENYINIVTKAGLFQGETSGKFRPDDQITRAEAITAINRLLGRDKLDKDSFVEGMKTWPDCPTSAWFYSAVQEATNNHDYYPDEKNDNVERWETLLPSKDWSLIES